MITFHVTMRFLDLMIFCPPFIRRWDVDEQEEFSTMKTSSDAFRAENLPSPEFILHDLRVAFEAVGPAEVADNVDGQLHVTVSLWMSICSS